MTLKLQIMLFLLFPLLGMAQDKSNLSNFHIEPDKDHMALSPYTFEQTIERLQKVLKSKNITVFATIDHQAEAKKVGEKLAPTTVFIVGNPKVGTALMQEIPYVAFVLPLKILVWEQYDKIWIGYKIIAPIMKEYGIEKQLSTAQKIDLAMWDLIEEVAYGSDNKY